MTAKGEKPCGRERVPFARQFFSSFIWPKRCGVSVGGNGAARAQEWGFSPVQTVHRQHDRHSLIRFTRAELKTPGDFVDCAKFHPTPHRDRKQCDRELACRASHSSVTVFW